MKQRKAGERTRTVTVRVGDMTAAIFEQLGRNMVGARGGNPISMTTLAGVGLDQALRDWCQFYGVRIPPGWLGHGS